MKNMKIGIDARLWHQTGVGRYIRNLVEGIDSVAEMYSGYEFYIYLMPEEYDLVVFNSANVHKRSVDIRWHSLQEQLHFPRILEKDHLDLMHFTYYSVPFRYKRPYILTLHDVIIYHYYTGKASTLPFPLYHLKHAAYKFLLSQIRSQAQRIIVPLESTKDEVIKLFPSVTDKIIVTKEGFDSRLGTAGGDVSAVEHYADKKYFLYVGNAYPHKNLEKLITAFSHIDESISLLLVGKNDFFYKKLKRTLPQHAEILHDLTDEELGFLYKHAVACISPSLMEGFGLPLLEAMSLSTPVVASKIPAFQEVCQDAAIYFDPHREQSMVSALMQALNLAKDTRHDMITKGKKYAKAFTWERMVRQTLEVYEQVLVKQ